MSVRTVLHTCLGIIFLGVLATSSASAIADPRRTTYFTFSNPVQLPGVSLPAGTYIFEIGNSETTGSVVQVFNRNRSKLYLSRLSYRTERPHNPVLKSVFDEQPAGTPPLVRAWFPMDETADRQFIY